MDLADHAKKFGILYLAGAILIGCVIVALAILSKQPKSGGGMETDERVALNHKKGHDKDPDKVQLWEGGPYWADRNIGAKNPWDYGYYFWWGDTIGYKRVNDAWVASDGSSRNFSFRDTSTDDKNIDKLKSEGWITKDGVLAPEHDAAHVHWGGNWRMPTQQELKDLCEKCDWEWKTVHGVKGYVVRGRSDYASAGIFLPCAGYGSWTSLHEAGSDGYYWSSVPDSDDEDDLDALSLFFLNANGPVTDSDTRNEGQSVRPVQGFTK